MPIAIQSSDGSGSGPTFRDIDASGNNFVTSVNRLVFSGNYPTGGDTLDLTPLMQAGIPTNAIPVDAFVNGLGVGTSQAAGGGYYAFLQNATSPGLTGNKIKIFASGGSELGAGAYPAAVTGDVITMEIVWRKFQ